MWGIKCDLLIAPCQIKESVTILIGLYNRYIPALRMSYLEIIDISKDSSRIIIDIRDYNVAYTN